MRGLMTLLSVMLSISSCSCTQPPASAGPLAKPATGPTSKAVDKSPAVGQVPVIYDPRLDPVALTTEQLKEITQEAAPLIPPGRQIWYVHVHASCVFEGKPYWNVTFFFTPDSATGRIRKGRCSGLRSEFRLYRAIAAKLSPDSQPATAADLLSEYVQVSLVNQPFGEVLQVPQPRLWPFIRPDGFSDDEIVEIVDFARTSPAPAPTTPDEFAVSWRFNGDEPIHRIKRLKDGVVEVWSGAQQDMLAGAGTFMTCIKKNGKWVVLSTGYWVS